MVIEIKGVGLKNKGAYLMLASILAKVRQRYKNAIIVAERGYGLNADDLASQGMKEKFKVTGSGRKVKVLKYLPKPLRKAFGLISTEDVDVVLDGSGFLYSDEWEVSKINSRLVNELETYKKNKAKVILLPQAFGPFNKPETHKSLSKIVNQASLVFARDETSIKHLTTAFGLKPNIIQAPDFTNVLKPKMADYNLQAYSNGIVIIPNFMMLTLNGADVGEIYLNFLKKAILAFQNLNENVFFLIHEGERDVKIAEEVNKSIAQPIEIINSNDPLYIKAIIGVSKIVITSRFHGLVSSLSQKVPTICTSWSHKYQMLMEEYEQEEFLVDILKIKDNELEDLLQKFNEVENLTQIKQKLGERSEHFYALTEQMWAKVFDCIDHNESL